jgi:hypothetical protein
VLVKKWLTIFGARLSSEDLVAGKPIARTLKRAIFKIFKAVTGNDLGITQRSRRKSWGRKTRKPSPWKRHHQPRGQMSRFGGDASM